MWELQCLAQSVEYFEVNLWLALYGVCIEAKQVIIKKKIKCWKKYKHQSWFTWTQTLPLLHWWLDISHVLSETIHTHVCPCLYLISLFVSWVGRLFLNDFISMWGSIYCLTMFPYTGMTRIFEMFMCFYFFDTSIVWYLQNNFMSQQVLQVKGQRTRLVLKSFFKITIFPSLPLTCNEF